MSNKIQIDVTTNTAKAIQGFQKVQKEILKTGQTAEKTNKKISGAGAKGGSAKGGFMGSLQDVAMNKLHGFDKWGISDKVSNLASMGGSFGRVGGMLAKGGPYAAVAGLAISPLLGMAYSGNKRAEQGQSLFNSERTLEQRLGNIQKNQGGSGYVKGLTHDLQQMAVKGKIPIEELTKTASRMMLAFKGNQSEVRKWTSIIADMAAATGESTDFFADLIARAEQFGTVEASVLTQMNEKGIPIFAELGKLLGVSTEQAKKLAEQGKITADQFKDAATAAHAISAANANQNNVVKDAAYYEKQTKYLQDKMYAETYTKQMNEMQTRRAKARYEKEKAYYEDPEIQTFHEEWARMCVGVCEMGERLKDGLADLGRSVASAASDIYNWIDDKINKTQDHNAKTATQNLKSHTTGIDLSAQMYGVSISDLVYNMEGANETTKLSEKIEQMRDAIRETEKRIANKYVDEENRKAGQEVIDRAKEQLAILEQTLEKKQKDIEAEKERQRLAKIALELQTKALTSDPQSSNDYIKAWNLNNANRRFQNADAVRKEFDAANERIRTGKGTEQDAAFIQFFKPMFDRIEKENEKQNALAKSRDEFRLQEKAKSGDKTAQMQLEFGSLIEQMQKLEFSTKEISAVVKNRKDEALAERKSNLDTLGKQRDSIMAQANNLKKALWSNKEFETGSMKKTEYERGAWGQGLAIKTPDTALYQAAQQLRAMQETNAKLNEQIILIKQEISAINKLNVTPRAM